MAFKLWPLNIIVSLFAVNLVLYAAALIPSQLIYQFPVGTWVENLAVRADGSILVTILTAPEVYLIQPSARNPDPRLIHRFEGYTSVTGITESSPDTFQVALTNRTAAGTPVPGTGGLWQIKFTGRKDNEAEVTLTAKLPDVGIPNGLVTLNRHEVLLADSLNGVVDVIDIKTGTSSVAIRDPLFTTVSSSPVTIGVNGLKIRGDTLFFTSSAQNLLGRIPIDQKTGSATGPATKIVNGLPPGIGYDDFALSKKSDSANVTNPAGNFIERVDLATKQQTIVSGQINSTDIAQPTAVAFGQNGQQNTLFVTTAGGLLIPVNGDEIVGGQIVAIELGGRY